MSPRARTHAHLASMYVLIGDYPSAISCLRIAIKGTTNRRAWSKLMLALRELSRIG